MNIVDVRSNLPRHKNPKRVYQRRYLNKIKRLVIHCSDSTASYEQIAKYDITPSPTNHLSKDGCPGFTYHYFIDKAGIIDHTSDLENVTWHAGDFNLESIGICLDYKATGNIEPPTELQMVALMDLCVELCLQLNIDPDNIVGHRELLGTGYNIINGKKKLRKECPGLLLNLDEFRFDLACNVQQDLADAGCDIVVDGKFGPLSEKALLDYYKSRKQ